MAATDLLDMAQIRFANLQQDCLLIPRNLQFVLNRETSLRRHLSVCERKRGLSSRYSGEWFL